MTVVRMLANGTAPGSGQQSGAIGRQTPAGDGVKKIPPQNGRVFGADLRGKVARPSTSLT